MWKLRVVMWQAIGITGMRDLVVSSLWWVQFSFVLSQGSHHVMKKWPFRDPSATQRLRCSLGPSPEFPEEGKEQLSWDQLSPLTYLTTGLGGEMESVQGPGQASWSCVG